MTAFALDARLDAESIPAAELGFSTLRLMKDRRFPWTILIPRRAGLAELTDLDAADRARLIEEIAGVSHALSRLTAAHKMNVAALGNRVRQLHVHVIARRQSDAAWPWPVWGRGTPEPYAEGEGEAFAARLTAALRAAGVI